jgi:hypothetical protein
MFFDMVDSNLGPSPKHNQVSGNPVKIRDGCATVTGYKLPQPLVPLERAGKAGARFMPEVRISAWSVLVVACRESGFETILKAAKLLRQREG